MDVRTRIVGLLRFSVLTTTYYTGELGSVEAVERHLFSPERMELRFHLFENLCLPSLKAQTDQDFEMVVLTSRRMPSPWAERLAALIEPLPNFRLIRANVTEHYRMTQRAYAAVPSGDSTHLIRFRLDDDDAVDRDFIARTRKYADALIGMQGPKTPFVMAWNHGFYVRRDPSGNDVFDATERAPLSVGTTLVAPVGHGVNPYRYVHRRLPQYYPTFTDTTIPAFLRTIHGDNKSNPSQSGLTRQLTERQILRRLRRNFGIDLHWLRSL